MEDREFEPALEYYHKALEKVVKEDDPGTQAIIFTNIGSINYEKGEYKEALLYLRQAETYYRN